MLSLSLSRTSSLAHVVSAQLWDIGGQPRFGSMWERYCRGVQVIVYVTTIFLSHAHNSQTQQRTQPPSHPCTGAGTWLMQQTQ